MEKNSKSVSALRFVARRFTAAMRSSLIFFNISSLKEMSPPPPTITAAAAIVAVALWMAVTIVVVIIIVDGIFEEKRESLSELG